MNCSVLTSDKLVIGTRDRRIYIYNKFSLELKKSIEVPESVHCMTTLNDCSQVAVGMTDGHILVLSCNSASDEE